MDETFVRLRNFSQFVVAEKGQKVVKVLKDHEVNPKIGSTFISTIAMDPRVKFPLICIAKGKTKDCETKYAIENEEGGLSLHSETGWTTEAIMFEYLDMLHSRFGDHFAVVLDVYPSHRTEEVKKYAEKLKIELIYVPACGTGEYQPLDRLVFGILKKKLQRQGQDFSGANLELYGRSFSQVKSALEEVSDRTIEKAWDMPGLREAFENITDLDIREYLLEQMETVEESEKSDDEDYHNEDDAISSEGEIINETSLPVMKTRNQLRSSGNRLNPVRRPKGNKITLYLKSVNLEDCSLGRLRDIAHEILRICAQQNIKTQPLTRESLRNIEQLSKWFYLNHREINPVLQEYLGIV